MGSRPGLHDREPCRRLQPDRDRDSVWQCDRRRAHRRPDGASPVGRRFGKAARVRPVGQVMMSGGEHRTAGARGAVGRPEACVGLGRILRTPSRLPFWHPCGPYRGPGRSRGARPGAVRRGLLVLGLAACALAACAGPARAQEIWSATLNPQGTNTGVGCESGITGSQNRHRRCDTASTLSDDGFTYDGTNYTVVLIDSVSYGNGTGRFFFDLGQATGGWRGPEVAAEVRQLFKALQRGLWR